MDRYTSQSIINGLQNCTITLKLGVAGGASKTQTFTNIPCVRTSYVQSDDMPNDEKIAEKMAFRFLTPCNAPNPTKADTITDEQGEVWTIIGAMSGADIYCRKWLAYITTPIAQGPGFSKGK